MKLKLRGPVGYVIAGSVKLPIYQSPVRIKANHTNADSSIGAKNAKSNAFKIYDSYEVPYYENGVKHVLRGVTPEAAKLKAKPIAARLEKEGSHVTDLSADERRMFVRAREILRPMNLEVDTAARMLEDVYKRLEGSSLGQAVDFFNAHGKRVIIGATTKSVYAHYLEDLDRRGVGSLHMRDVRRFVGGYVEQATSEFARIRTKEIDDHLASLGGKARSKNNARDKIIALFNFGQRKDYLPKGIEHAAKSTTPFTDPRPVLLNEEDAAASANPTEIYLPDEMSLILGVANFEERLTVELKGFSGIRTEELSRLWWILIDEKGGHIKISKAIAKLNQRAMPIVENLKKRLVLYPDMGKHDKVCKRWNSSNALYHLWQRLAKKAGVPYKKNGFRNSFISYRLALTKDIKQVAYESGNSPDMIKRYYLDLVTPEQAQQWFSL